MFKSREYMRGSLAGRELGLRFHSYELRRREQGSRVLKGGKTNPRKMRRADVW